VTLAYPSPPKTPYARRTINQQVEALLEQINQGHTPNHEDLDTLRAYTGRGSLESGNNESNLAAIQEYYTPDELARVIWAKVGKATNYQKIRALEPACGIGRFFPWINGELLTGIEIDPISSQIARLLYPDATIINAAFEDYSKFERFDVVITNPPFGVRGAKQLIDKPEIKDYPIYYAHKGLDLLNDGGLLVLIMPSGYTSSARHLSERCALMARSRLKAVYRLPHSTFADGGAKLQTDLIFLEKRPWQVGDVLCELTKTHGPQALAASFGISQVETHYIKGEFFDEYPNYRTAPLVVDSRFGDTVVDGSLGEACAQIQATKFFDPSPAPTTFASLYAAMERSNWAGGRAHQLLTQALLEVQKIGYPHQQGDISNKGTVFELSVKFSPLRLERRWNTPTTLSPMRQAVEKMLIALDDFLEARRKIPMETSIQEELDISIVEKKRLIAYNATKEFIDVYGNPHQNNEFQGLIPVYPRYNRICGAVAKDGTINPDLCQTWMVQLDPDLPDEEKFMRLLEQKVLTPQLLSQTLKISFNDALERLLADESLALAPGGIWEAWSSYANGNVRHVAALTERQMNNTNDPRIKARLAQQIEQLNKSFVWRRIEEIDLSGREGFIPKDVVIGWIKATYPHLIAVEHDGKWKVDCVDRSERRKLVIKVEQARDDARLIEDYLNFTMRAGIVEGASKLTKNEYLARRKSNIDHVLSTSEKLKISFKVYVAENPEYRALIEDEYNSRYNVATALEPTQWLNFPQWKGLKPRRSQIKEASLRVERGGGLTAFGTGGGKTITAGLIIEGILMRGIATRVAVAVPKGLLTKHSREVVDSLPHRRFVVVGLSWVDGKPVDDSAELMREKLVAVSLGAYDVAIMSHDTYRRIPFRSETLQAILRDEALSAAQGKALQKLDSNRTGNTAYSFTKDVAAFESNLADAVQLEHPIHGVYWEDMGFDGLVIDEAGVFRNLYAAPQHLGQKLAFIGAGAESARSLDHFVKCRYTKRVSHHKLGTMYPLVHGAIFLLSATPADNSPLELYSLLKPLAAESFCDIGIFNTEQFIDRFCVVESVVYPNLAGNLTVRPGVVSFKNMDELRGILGRYVTYATAENLGLQLPTLTIQEHSFAMSQVQEMQYQHLRKQADSLLAANRRDKGADVLRLFGAMRGLALDPAFYSQDPFAFNPRYAFVAYLARSALNEGGQVICFLDWGSPAERDEEGKPTGAKLDGPDAFERLKSEMVSLGIPPEQVAIVTASRFPGAKRQDMIDRYNAGEFKVMIATRGSLGIGGDLQHGTTDIIHGDLPPSPGAWDQSNGRGVRQGNTNEAVRVHVLLAQGTLDGVLYAILRGKKSWREQLFATNASEIANSELLTYEDMLVALSPNPELARARLEQLNRQIQDENRLVVERQRLRALELYCGAWKELQVARERAYRRKNGLTQNDNNMIHNLTMQLKRHASEVERLVPGALSKLEHGGVIQDQRLFVVGTTVKTPTGATGTIRRFEIDLDGNKRILAYVDSSDGLRRYEIQALTWTGEFN
jgi:hypothetical protein